MRCYPARTQAYEIYPQKQRRNSTCSALATRSGARPPTGSALQLRTKQAYPSRIPRSILASGKRHPAQMGQSGVEVFLSRLATHAQVSAGTQNPALAMSLFL
uniref:phage integrase N-terminal SAM-like domain-containing protein n=1 Tax=Xanthomonas cannabis TaxID=1885674 RepID=UPI00224C52A5